MSTSSNESWGEENTNSNSSAQNDGAKYSVKNLQNESLIEKLSSKKCIRVSTLRKQPKVSFTSLILALVIALNVISIYRQTQIIKKVSGNISLVSLFNKQVNDLNVQYSSTMKKINIDLNEVIAQQVRKLVYTSQRHALVTPVHKIASVSLNSQKALPKTKPIAQTNINTASQTQKLQATKASNELLQKVETENIAKQSSLTFHPAKNKVGQNNINPSASLQATLERSNTFYKNRRSND